MKRPISPALALLIGLVAFPPPCPGGDQKAPAPPATQAETPKPSFPAAVELVTVDAAVVDKTGKAAAGLGKHDFVVTDNGAPQVITSFEAVVVPETPREAAAAPAVRRAPFSANLVEARRARTFLVVFDDIHLSPAQALRAKGAVAEFLRSGVAEGDRVTLIATGGGAWWNERMPEGRDQLLAILKRLDGRYVPDSSPDRITEYEAMRIEEYQDQQVADKVQRRFDNYGARGSQQDPRGVKPPDADQGSAVGIPSEVVRSRAQEVHNLSTSRNKITLGVMARAIEGLAGIKGRKAMIMVSQGFIYDVQLDAMKKVVEASTRANVPIYFIDTRGLQALPEAFTAAFGRPLEAQDTVAVLADITFDAAGSEAIALDTGGFAVKNSNDLVNGIKRVSNESRAYYLLGYVPSDLRRDGKFRKIEVKLKGARAKGLTVRARRGYYAPSQVGVTPPKPAETTDPLIAKALDSPFEMEDVPLRVSAFVFDEAMLDQLNVTIAAEVDARKLDFKQEEGRFKDSLAFLIEAQHRETGEYYRYDQTIEMSLLPETRQRLERTWFPASREFALPPGGYQVKVVVRDLNSGRIGSVIHDFEVPSAGSFRLSSPVLSEVLEEGTGGSRKPVLQVGRSFPREAMLWCQFSVYGAARDEKGSLLPQVSAGYEIRRADDAKLFKRAAPSRINATSVGALMRLNGISLRGAPPGEYELVLSVRDELAGKAVEVREPFVVEAAGPAVSSR
jgi:VWFA-related protein